jgi:apolipoprotein N-acyltransferase
VAAEWVRSWLFTGFPWNQLGTSQWQNGLLLPLTATTGIYGISFVIVTVNAAVFLRCYRPSPQFGESYRPAAAPTALAAALLAVAVGARLLVPEQPAASGTLAVTAVQGNLPQARQSSEAQLDFAIDVYTDLTREAVRRDQPQLVVWPETAIPRSLLYNDKCRAALEQLFAETGTPMLAGTIDYRYGPPPGEELRQFNSAMLFAADGALVEFYDKIHIVPFGEFVPFGRFLPWLVDWIGMGRGLTPGTEHTVFDLGEAQVGVNICYEDVFPEISAGHAAKGANILITITNDAWFGATAGSRQHLAHAVFRAVETGRPMLRNGNNSDTCLIHADGRIEGLLYGADGERFVRGAALYAVPIVIDPPLTLYSRTGNWFAGIATVLTALAALWCSQRWLQRKRRLYAAVTGVEA